MAISENKAAEVVVNCFSDCNIRYLPTISQTNFLKLKHINIEHIIFDLGGVIINLDPQKTINAFAQITSNSPEKIISFSNEHPAFHQYEKGQIEDHEFRNVIRTLTHKQLTDNQIDTAWNAMILDLPIASVQLLHKLKANYGIYLLSNTNYIHMKKVNEVREEAGIETFASLFNKDYYSHLMGKRKPDAEIFEEVLDNHGLQPHKTLFIDDNLSNINGASALGIATLHVSSPYQLVDYFNER